MPPFLIFLLVLAFAVIGFPVLLALKKDVSPDLAMICTFSILFAVGFAGLNAI